MNDEDEIVKKIQEYSEFVSHRLRPDLDLAEKSKKETLNEIAGYEELREKLLHFAETKMTEYESMVDLGYQRISCKAIGDVSKICIHVGMGFHVEMTIDESLKYVMKRLEFLQTIVLKRKEQKVNQTTQRITMVCWSRELQRGN